MKRNSLKINRDFSHGLHRIRMENDTPLVGYLRHIPDGKEYPCLIVRPDQTH